MSKKSQTVNKPKVQGSGKDIKQTIKRNIPADNKVPGHELEGSELFSFFTANIIKEEKVFTR